MPDFTDLIARLETATEGSRELDAEIVRAVDPDAFFADDGSFESAVYDCINRYPPHYTTSLDAALTLVPEGWGWSVDYANACMLSTLGGDGHVDYLHTTYAREAATPALALVIAALKARQAGQ